ncbi:MAG: UvrD-helicase domain-containing protein [Alphaproteobacteria bacterium]|nr:UvrD-helicase domain-containing protein [Alphaproteobacteria bacterium]
MTEKTKFTPEQDVAADPTKNIWVQANAGTGKTKVLVYRLLRILFRSPNCSTTGILCLTYTNAAAGEMRNRILKELRNWATATDEQLSDLLDGVTENGNVTASDIAHARRIFFEYIDNPEILKIKTIHGFCEEILHRFPLEVNLSPSWSLASDTVQHVLQQDAFSKMINHSNNNTYIQDAFAHIVNMVSEKYLDDMLGLLTEQYKYFFQIDDFDTYRQYFIDTTKDFLNINVPKKLDIDTETLKNIIMAAQNDNNTRKNPVKYLNTIITKTQQYIDKTIDFNEYKNAYLTDKYTKDKNISKQEYLVDEQNRVYETHQYLANKQIFDNTIALFDLSAAFAKTYREIKQQRNLLDFEDLILYTKKLFSQPNTMGWVLSQLNISLSHILIDEAQDTSPTQWDILRMLVDEFFTEGDTPERQHSLFVVGDSKQSIYGFQGADSRAFARSREQIATQISQNMRTIHDIPLEKSFRSVPVILNSVDKFFTNPSVTDSTGFNNNPHKHFKNDSGIVEIHKLVSARETDNNTQTYVKTIADKIHDLIKTGKYKPKDIMVLVQKRAPFAVPLLNELQKQEIPVAGSDRVKLPTFPAICDLLNLIRFCINQADDYSLCCVLKSPIFRLTDADIFKLCSERNKINKTSQQTNKQHQPITVYDILKQYHPDIFDKLTEFIKMSEIMAPYTFFSNILTPDIRASFIAALGKQVIVPIDEFMTICLSYERTQPGTLYHFIKNFITGNSEVKRDLNATDGVRVVTVHGSKGLEAPVVFLIDTVTIPENDEILTIPTNKNIDKKYVKSNIFPPVWIWTKGCDNTEQQTFAKNINKQQHTEEYYRLLYVAMTRACAELYIYGYTPHTLANDMAWYTKLQKVFVPDNQSAATYIRITE